jgi:UDP-3-O-[3-hydroxymyristoyl] glucosamine N-acyltransferase
MTEPLFYKRPSGLTVTEIATLVKAEPAPGARLDRRITNIAPIDEASPSDLTFYDKSKFSDALAATEAGACLIGERLAGQAPEHLTVLRVQDPYRAFVAVAGALFPGALRPSSLFEADFPCAIVHPTARLRTESRSIRRQDRTACGDRRHTVIAPTAVIGPDVRIGRDCAIGPGATVVHALLGDRVIIHAGCKIDRTDLATCPGRKG